MQEIWLTFSDPQMKNPRKRLTSTYFLERYRHFLVDGGVIHLKTDSNFLFTYTSYVVDGNKLPLLFRTTDLYGQTEMASAGDGDTASAGFLGSEETKRILSIHTYYENMWIERGIPIKYQKFLLLHDAPLTEPEVEIELDEYRSYHRDKRSTKDKAV